MKTSHFVFEGFFTFITFVAVTAVLFTSAIIFCLAMHHVVAAFDPEVRSGYARVSALR